MTTRLAWLTALGLLTSCTQVAKMCTEIGCQDGLSVQLVGTLPAEDVTVTLAYDGATQTCTFGPSESPDDASCDSTDLFVLTDFDGDVLVVAFGTPESLTLTVEAGGGVLVDETLTPTYFEQQPNGEGCEPTCRNAVEQVSLP